MKTFKTEKSKDRAERKAYRAMDALQDLLDHDIAAREAELAMVAIRKVIERVQITPVGI